MKMKTVLRLIGIWPPYLASGIRVSDFSPDINNIKVKMSLHFWNKGLFHTHFGGSLYSMTDPFFAFILIHHLGKDYIVWDKGASIDYKQPGKGTVFATFSISPEQIEQIRQQADALPKVEPVFHVQVLDKQGGVVAEVEKILYVKRKDKIKKRENV